MTICNKYNNTLEDFIDSSNIKLSNMPRPIDKRPCNIMSDFENPSTESKLDKNILDKLHWQ